MCKVFLYTSLRIAKKDLKIEFRRVYEILSILSFAIGSIFICSFACGGAMEPEVGSAVLWIILFFASILSFTTSFVREADRGTLGGLKTLPCPSLAILFGKILYGIALLSIIECTLIPFSIVFLDINIGDRLLLLTLVLFMGISGLSLAGSFISGLLIFSEGKTLLLPLLLLPVCIPILIPANLATGKLLSGSSATDIIPELRLMTAFILLMIAIMTLTFEFVIEE